MQPDDRIRRAGGRRFLDGNRDSTPVAGSKRRPPANGGGSLAHRLRPIAVGRRVVRYECLAFAGQVTEADLDPVQPQLSSRGVHLRFVCPGDLRGAETAKSGTGGRVRRLGGGSLRTRAMMRCIWNGFWVALQTTMPSVAGAAVKPWGSMAKWVTMGNE